MAKRTHHDGARTLRTCVPWSAHGQRRTREAESRRLRLCSLVPRACLTRARASERERALRSRGLVYFKVKVKEREAEAARPVPGGVGCVRVTASHTLAAAGPAHRHRAAEEGRERGNAARVALGRDVNFRMPTELGKT